MSIITRAPRDYLAQKFPKVCMLVFFTSVVVVICHHFLRSISGYGFALVVPGTILGLEVGGFALMLPF